jgi:queuine/archaeosine tRNA-ribosyltransferase
MRTIFKLPKLYSDSGGLQMALYGKPIDTKARAKIYKVQEDYSDLAFCFDDIPIRMLESSGVARLEVKNKYFDPSLLKEKALKTADNIKEQIAYFKEHGRKTKVFAIVQGNCADTFTDWGNYLFDHLTDAELDDVFGIALADTCAGNGLLETIQMSQALHRIDAPERIKQNVHYLGIGSITRMMPVIELAHTPILKGRTCQL